MRYIITGAASGIGRAVAILAAEEERAQFVLADIDAAGLEETAQYLAGVGAKAIAIPTNVIDPEACERLVRRAEQELGGIDALISNAGSNRPSIPLKDLDIASFDRLFDINTRPTWLLGKAAYAALAQSRGAIVATASMASEHATPPLGTYSASKAALVMLMKQMALEWGPAGIRCNCVSPGPTDTGMTRPAFGDPEDAAHRENRAVREAAIPLRRIGAAEDVARMILFLAGRQASQITGVNIAVDGGLSVSLMPATGSGQGYSSGM